MNQPPTSVSRIIDNPTGRGKFPESTLRLWDKGGLYIFYDDKPETYFSQRMDE